MAGLATFLPSQPRRAMSASLIGHSGSSAFRLSTTTVSMSLTGSCFSSESAPGALPSWDSRTRWNNLSGAVTGAEPSGLGGHPAGGSRPKRKVPLRCRLCRNERFRRSGASFWWAQVRPEAPIRLIVSSMCRACGRPQEETLCRNKIRSAMIPPSSSSSAS